MVRQIKAPLGNVCLGFLLYISRNACTTLERTTVSGKSCLYFHRAVPTLLYRLLDLVNFLCVYHLIYCANGAILNFNIYESSN